MPALPEDLRILAMLDWLENDLLMPILSCEPASNDASFRRYFRITTTSGSYVVMDAPPDKENTAAFIRIASIMRNADIHVPAIFHQNLADGFLVLEDFGTNSFLDKLNTGNADHLYQSAFQSLIKIQTQIPLENSSLPLYNEQLLQRELCLFNDWFLSQLLDIEFPDNIQSAVYNLLIVSAVEQPVTCVHRDYHSRNLMALNLNSPGVLDFQDAVIGPITYDLVSLLRDCYIAWPQQQVELWVNHYFQLILQMNLVDCDFFQFKRWFDLMGMQRHLKAIGIFSRLHLRDGKSNYLKDIPRTLNYVRSQASFYPELSEFSNFIDEHILPASRITA